MGITLILRNLLSIFKKSKKGGDGSESHRLIYYGDVPLIETSESEYLEKYGRRSSLGARSKASPTKHKAEDTEEKKVEDNGDMVNVDNLENGDVANEGLQGDKFQKESMESGAVLSLARSSFNTKPLRASSRNVMNPRRRNLAFTDNRITTSRYTFLNFLPKNLFEQFRRPANFYFLIMAIIQSTIKSPVHPLTAAVPLLFVIATTAVKQGYEDWLRHKADEKVNNRPVCIVRDSQLLVIKAKALQVGDIIKLDGEDQVPADILIVGSSDEFLRCQITTANLDGETNLKMRYCPAGLTHLKSERDFYKLHIILECEQPNPSLYEFNGCILVPPNNIPSRTPGSFSGMSSTFHSKIGIGESGSGQPSFVTVPLSMENMVLRGTRIKNTDFVFGLVVYTGKDTRLARNSKETAIKYSTVDKTESRFLCVFVAILIVMVMISVGMHYICKYSVPSVENAFYLYAGIEPQEGFNFQDVLEKIASFLILFNYIIPISLYVTVEMQKFFGSKFFAWDIEMRCPLTGHSPVVNTSDINDELGQVNYLFTDKTGTLTENIMQFRHCSVGGEIYDFEAGVLRVRGNTSKRPGIPVDLAKKPNVVDFIRTLALCHSVQLMPIRRPSFESANSTVRSILPLPKSGPKLAMTPTRKDSVGQPQKLGILGKWEYQASSPDEKALLESCYKLDIKYLGEREDKLTLDVLGQVETYKRHFVLEFDSERKCMSVIVENQSREIWLLIKGAESTILPNCTDGPVEEVMKSVSDFAMMGMRTLAVAKRNLTKIEFETFSHKLKSARRLLKGRDEAMRELYRSVESNLTVIGATGVEDELQSGVPEMLQALSAAGIKIWMLTGDKIETGVSVAMACGLLTPSSKQYFLTHTPSKTKVKAKLEALILEIPKEDNTILIIDGTTLAAAFEGSRDLLLKITQQVHRVVCCRMAPLQKAQVIHMVKTSVEQPITAAVGDGANDVAMIQEAHIGIGILGKEGRQAARSADFALARSSFLKKALLVHGHWFYVRLAILVIYFFYKNIVFIGPQALFCFYSAFSTQSLYDGTALMMYNIFYTSNPIFTYGLQEQPYSAKTLMSCPHLYKSLSGNSYLSWSEFARWCVFAVYHSAVCFYIPYFCWPLYDSSMDWCSFGTLVNCCVVGVANLKLLVETNFISGWTVFSYFFSFGTMFIFVGLFFEGNLDRAIHEFLTPGECRHVYFSLLGELRFWLIIFLVIVIALAPDLMFKRRGRSSRRNRDSPIRLTNLIGRSRGRLAVSTATLQSYVSRSESDMETYA